MGPQWTPWTRSWVHRNIEECIESHDCCPSPTESPLPTRVLMIQKTPNNPSVHLHVPTELERGRYACLSHCWGDGSLGHIPLRTTHQDNVLERFCANIPWEDLPRTFQDAIVVVLDLGLQYLWVDSLCIIQDDDRDWRKEAASMSEVYANAFITISATASPHSQGSLFGTSQATQRQQSYIQIRPRIGNATVPMCSRISVRHWWHDYAPGSNIAKMYEVGHREVDTFPLLNRGWVFQERILSPRVLHFSREEVVLECAYGNTCQCYGTWFRGNARAQGLLKPHFNFQQLWSQGDEKHILRKAMASWLQVLERYSILQFTVAKDRVPALAGVAQSFLPAFKGKYFAGVWEDVLATTLAWGLEYDVERRVRPEGGFLVPSWSPLASQGLIYLELDVILNPTMTILSLPGGRTTEDLAGMRDDKTPMILSIRAYALATRLTCKDSEFDISTDLDITDLSLDYEIPISSSGIEVLFVNTGYYNRMIT
jgi:heterokaryon incompatibility protein (HET)